MKYFGTFILLDMYGNEVCNITKQSKFITYADDISIFITDNHVKNIVNFANTILKLLSGWMDKNLVKINPNEVKTVLLRPKNRPETPPNNRFADLLNHSMCIFQRLTLK